ncbi:MAG TPA: NAD-dependent epimerase/dehydratase family protein [Chloroflexota bacterium]|nr:NAD-dependent epimerase/dehydratase family protein [Chloroflexota bacterium]
MRVLVLHGTGLVGAWAVRRLSELGHEVVVAHRGHTEPGLPPEVRHIHHPSLDSWSESYLEGVAGELRAVAPEIVVDCMPVNDRDAGAVMRLFTGVARRMVGISSVDVYRAYGRLHRTEPGPPDAVPLTEDAPLRERHFPDHPRLEKLLAERALLSQPALPGTVLRWPMVYGPRDGAYRLWAYLRRMDAGRPAILLEQGLARWRWTRGYSENVAHAVVLAVTDERAAGRVYNVGEAEALTEAEWVRAIGRAAGWEGEVVVVPEERAPDRLRPRIDTGQHWVVDTGRIRRELGYAEPVRRDEALRRTVAWQRSTPPPPGRGPSAEEQGARDAAEEALLATLGNR